jgi:NADH:ubiquinone oxidoreductase subunit 4 (subunit M)
LILKQFGFLNFFRGYSKLFAEKSFYISSLIIFTQGISGIVLLSRIYDVFYPIIYQYQIPLTVVILISALYHTLILFKNSNLACSFNSVYIIGVSAGLLGVISCAIEKSLLIYYFVVLLISYVFLLFVFAIIENKFHTKNIYDFKKINDKTKILQMLVLYSLMNFAKLPVGANFFALLYLYLSINSVQFSNPILIYAPYVILLCIFVAAFYIFDLISKILMEPTENSKDNFNLLCHQKVVLCIIICFLLLFIFQKFIFDVCSNYLIGKI